MAENQEQKIDPIESVFSRIVALVDSFKPDSETIAKTSEILAEIESFKIKAQSSKQIGSDLDVFLLALQEILNPLPEDLLSKGTNELNTKLKELEEELEGEIDDHKDELKREADRQADELLNLLEKVVNEASDLELRAKLIIFTRSARKDADDHKTILLQVDTMQSVY